MRFRFCGFAIVLMACGSALWIAQASAAETITDPEQPAVATEEVWYVPVVAHFKVEFERDRANQAKQSWGDYWGWVLAFYRGNFLATGWDARSKTIVTCVHSESRRNVIRAKLNTLGRELCAEWAKHSDVRKINSSDLIRWGKEMDRAREKDLGRGEELEKELERIAGEVKKRKGR